MDETGGALMNTPTPGPWHWVRYEGGTYACLEAADGTDVIRRVRDDAGFMDIGVPNSADAALLARAWTLPALLAAAEAVIREATDHDAEEIDGMSLVSWLVLGELQAAIAQARGE
jgi:hypothetical protein